MDKRTEQFLKDPIFPLLIKMSAPNTVAFLINAVVVLAEFWFISQLGITPLAAVTLAFPAIMLTQQMAFGALGGAVTSSIARSLGAADKPRAEKLLWHSLYISCFGALAFLIIFFIFGEPLLRILGGTGALLEESLAYCFVYLLGAIVVWLSGSLTAALRGMGDMQFPAVLTVICAGIQVFFSAGFILGSFGLPKLGLVGSAWSMIVTSGFMALVTLIKISSPSSPVRLKLKRLTIERELFEDIFSVALPASLSPIMTVATVLLLTGLIGQFGTSAIAGYGIGSRVEFLLIPIVFGIGTAMTAMVGTNIGAKNIERAEKIGMVGATTAGLLSAVIGLALALTPNLWISIFTSDPETLLVTKQYIQILGVCYVFQGYGLSLYFASQGANAMKWPIIITAIRLIVFSVIALVAVYWLSYGLVSIFYASAIAMVIFGILMVISLKMGAWRDA
ncbi:MATE family efflux transporter [Gammaproteobacteria bacterium]|jgi:putative MATE family efflux protein|uniref:Multidrug-efflux transporter n=1 Tax=Gamma-proteobacterium EBAC31A08 TaxID=133804 RepID=Q9F7Q3_PRB01|nr:predicted cation efflux pump [uncultured marine gamma proteobacterium EBAC31A08]MDA9621615.1 MATE family efflux transporter [Gammaproteobacteria bacterium]